MEKRRFHFHIWYFLVAILIILIFQNFKFGNYASNLAYSDFKTLLKNKQVEQVSLGENYITATLKPDELEKVLPKEKFEQIKNAGDGKYIISTVRVPDPLLIPELEAAQVPFAGEIESKWVSTLLSWIIPIILFFALWSFLINRKSQTSESMAFGKSKAKIYVEKGIKTTFQNVAGADEAKGELREIVEFLKNPKRYHHIGARLPKGVLLIGPPGTGKTLLARAVAGEAKVPFFPINGSEFVELFVGVGAARVRDLFERARLIAPAIIFIDELDALGKARGASGSSGGHDEKEQTLNQLLSELDGFDNTSGLVLLAATNRPETLDQALLRAGRFDRIVLVDRPDKIGRKEILNIHLKKILCHKDLDPENIAAITPGFTGADLANLVNEAALLAVRRNAETVNMDDFTCAIERVVAGLEKKNRVLNQKECEIVAYHEIGHALVALFLLGADSIQKISIIPRGIKSLGSTTPRPTGDRYLMTKTELQTKMVILLGGCAAEHIKFGLLSTGASDDLVKVTSIARSMIMHYGMHEKLGQVSYGEENSTFLSTSNETSYSRNFSEETAQEIDRAVREMVKNAFEQAVDIITKHKPQLEHGTQLLLKKETLDEKDIILLLNRIEEKTSEVI